MMQVRILWLILTAALVATVSMSSPDTKTYIIHMDHSKVMELKNSNQQLQDWYNSILESTRKLAAQDDEDELAFAPAILYTYETVMTGFAAKLTTKQYQFLSNFVGVLSAVPDTIRSLQTTHTPHFLGLEMGRGLWNSSSFGSDVIIGVVDTGIWPEHISFRDFGMSPVPSRWKGICEEGMNFTASNCNKKVIGARSYFKGYEAAYRPIDEKVGFRSARDSDGHGTHTASTAGGNPVSGASLFGLAQGVASGMSPSSRLAVYKVCWQEGCSNSDIVAAIDQAVADGVDVLSLSLGGDPIRYYHDSTIIAALSASEKGVFVSFSAGNSGPSPSSVGNVAPWVMTVAANYVDRTFPAQVKLSNGKIFKGSSLHSGLKKTKQLAIVYKETAGGKWAEFCANGSLSSRFVRGKIVLCKRGMNYRTEKGLVVKSAGGAGMLLFNMPSEGEELLADAHVLPAASLGALSAKAIIGYLKQNRNLTASISFLGTSYGAKAPIVSAMSSRGPSVIDPYVIKPDITAPGVNILAAWPPIASITDLESDKRRVQFNIMTGTSMSCPHVSGIAALIKSVHPNWSPAAIKSAIMTTAYIHDDRRHLISDASSVSTFDKFASPFGFGSGHINPKKAYDPGLIYDITGEDYLLYLCSINYTNAQVSVLAKRKYTCPSGHKGRKLNPGDLNYPSFAVILDSGKEGNTTFTYKRTVTNVGDTAKIKYKVFVEKPKDVEVHVKPQVLEFNSKGEKQIFEVDFVGVRAAVRKGVSSFGSLTWVGEHYSVRSPIAVTWQ